MAPEMEGRLPGSACTSGRLPRLELQPGPARHSSREPSAHVHPGELAQEMDTRGQSSGLRVPTSVRPRYPRGSALRMAGPWGVALHSGRPAKRGVGFVTLAIAGTWLTQGR